MFVLTDMLNGLLVTDIPMHCHAIIRQHLDQCRRPAATTQYRKLHGSSCFQLIDLWPKINETNESQIVIMPARYSLICRAGDVNAAERHVFVVSWYQALRGRYQVVALRTMTT